MRRRLTVGLISAILGACAATDAGQSTVPSGPPPTSSTTTSTTTPPPSTTSSTNSPPPSTMTTAASPATTETNLPIEGRTSGRVAIVGEEFRLGGTVTNPGSSAEGLLMNSRMVQAIIDIEGPNQTFAYPDTGTWDAERNTTEFIAALPTYTAAGLNAVTINLQGGNPLDAPVQDRPPWRISAYSSDGSLDPRWAERLDRVLRAADAEGLAVILGLFYFGQDHHLEDAVAVRAAVDGVVDWILTNDHENVLIEICNECNVHYDHEILQPPAVAELMTRVRDRSEGKIPVGMSLTGGRLPGGRLITAADFVLLHGNRQDSDQVAEMVRTLRSKPAFAADPKPIVFNEDSTTIDNMLAAVAEGAGWGYHDKGTNDYTHGFQAPPVNWAINTEAKRSFFNTVSELTAP